MDIWDSDEMLMRTKSLIRKLRGYRGEIGGLKKLKLRDLYRETSNIIRPFQFISASINALFVESLSFMESVGLLVLRRKQTKSESE
jgi:hypothetical protein